MKLIIILLALMSVFLLIGVKAQDTPAEYVCGPCSCGNDDTVYKEPGNCPVCGMALVNKKDLQQNVSQRPQQLKAAILIFDGVQIIDFTGPYEVFGQAGINAFTVAEKATPITTSMGMKVTPSFTFENAPTAEILLVPGGNVDPHLENTKIIQWIQKRADAAQYVLSVCNGAFYLAKAGLLDGKDATTFYGLIDELKSNFPKVRVHSDRRFADNGKIITSAGLSSGIDGTLHLISKIYGNGRAQSVALNMEYNWQPDVNYARANFADKYIRRIAGRSFELPNGGTVRVVSTQGTNDQWAAEWELNSKTSLVDLQKFFETKLQENGQWTRKSDWQANSSQWKFSGDKGEPWEGTVNLAPINGQQDTYKLSLKIRRFTS
jgi:putative intracellular protease/amidase